MTDSETKITVTGLNGITDAGSGVKSVAVLHSTTSNSTGATETAVPVGTDKVVLTGLTPATTYYIWTRATDYANNVAGPTPVAGGGAVSTLDDTAPTGLGSVTAALGSDRSSQIVLSNLGAVTDNVGVTSFTVLRSTTNNALTATEVNAGTAALAQGTFTLSGLTAGTTYYLWTKATDAASNVAGPTAVVGSPVTTESSGGSYTASGVTLNKYASTYGELLTTSDYAAGDGYNETGVVMPTIGPPANLEPEFYGVFPYSQDFTFWILARPRSFFMSAIHQYHMFFVELGTGTSQANWVRTKTVIRDVGQTDQNSYNGGQQPQEIGACYDSLGQQMTRTASLLTNYSLNTGYRVFAMRQRLTASGGSEAGRVVITGAGATVSSATYSSTNPPISPTGASMRVSFVISARMMPHMADFAWRNSYMTDAQIFADASSFLAMRNSNP